VTVQNPAPPASKPIEGMEKVCLYVPPGSAKAYGSAPGWNAFGCIKDVKP